MNGRANCGLPSTARAASPPLKSVGAVKTWGHERTPTLRPTRNIDDDVKTTDYRAPTRGSDA